MILLDAISRQRLGIFLRNKREVQGITQRSISREMGYGSSQYVSNWERGLCLPPSDLIILCSCYNISRLELAEKILTESRDSIFRLLKIRKKKPKSKCR